jgi:hypothetical protein
MKERFERFISPEPNSGCWIWTGTGDAYGYGHFGIAHSRSAKAHRVAYNLYCGEIPDGKVVRHKCDTPACVNPQHLVLGSHADNSRDRSERMRTAVGTQNGKSKLTPELVKAIRSHKGSSARQLAFLMGVNPNTVYAVLSGRTWSHV